MPNNPDIAYLVTLGCHHVVMYYPAPKIGDLVYCRKCVTWRKAVNVNQSWRWRCVTKGCPGSQGFGTDMHRARRGGIRHGRLYAGHRVWLYRGAIKVEMIGTSQPTLPIVIES